MKMVKEHVKKLTRLFIPTKDHDKPLKRSLSGYETENFILNNDGSIDHSDPLLKKAQKQKLNVQAECAKSMIEVICFPYRKLSSTSKEIVNSHIKLTEIAEKNNKHIYPFATYFGINKPSFRQGGWYTVKEKVLGKERFTNAGLCCGFHQHYTLPRGMFDHKTKMLHYKLNSKVKKTMLDGYNFIIAMDPILTTLLQASPFVNCKHLAKDSRTVLYRGGKKLNYMKGLYGARQLFGGLPPYKQTLGDLLSTLNKKHAKWISLLKRAGYGKTELAKSSNILDYAWNPVKINKHGTIEYRGGDMNFLSQIFGVSTMMKYSLRKIYQDFMLVVPMDIDVKEAFKIENNMIFIPPHTIVRNEFQKHSAYEGFKNKELTIYINRFYKFIKSNTPKKYHKLLEPIKKTIEEKRTISDKILAKARRAGYKDKITQEYAKELALFYSEKNIKDLHKTKAILEKIEG